MPKVLRLFVTFPCTSEALEAQRIVLDHGITCKLSPVPRSLSAGCGLALEADPQWEAAIQKTLLEGGVEVEEIHQISL
ncbi:hypothetical protein ABB02_01142 [Clostridiaceae bacterium JG1575]|nr:hypothetical protein ABB02_01142 [Clostridiaceae bacterium JG1575]